MLDDYKDEQPIAYTILKNALSNNCLSHAYLIEANNYNKKENFALAFASAILCPCSYTNNNNCKDCLLCTQIKNRDFLELKIINPAGTLIKKDQLNELQIDFSTKPVLGNRKVYIINDADKMNKASANSLLKFLEEPEEGIYAILVVNSISQLLETIVSRCQIISLRKNPKEKTNNLLENIGACLSKNIEEYNLFVNNEDNMSKIDMYIKFIDNYERIKKKLISHTTKLISYLNNKDELEFFFNIIILYYQDVLNCLIDKNCEIFPGKYLDNIKFITSVNTMQTICNKIKTIIDIKENVKVNANTNLLIDKLITELARCD